MTDEVILETEDKMDKTVQFLQQELSGLRTGKANPALVDTITVDYYGTPTRLRDIANISTPEPRLIVINPFDPYLQDTIIFARTNRIVAPQLLPVKIAPERQVLAGDEVKCPRLGWFQGHNNRVAYGLVNVCDCQVVKLCHTYGPLKYI